jgi:hypothetical protein
LAEYRPTVTALTDEERECIIDQALLMLEQVFAHLPLKRALHGTEPIQRLRLLRLRHHGLDERTFQSQMIDIFTDLRDLHTRYILPRSYWSKFAFLPFRIEEFYEGEIRQFVVSWVSPVNPNRKLKPGVIVTHWNGSPVDLAVARNAEREAGSNPDARRAQGIEALTLRWLGMSLPPDEDWVVLTYTDGRKTYESKFDWEIIDDSDRSRVLEGLLGGEVRGAQARWGLDLKTTLLQRARKALFDPQAILVEDEMTKRRVRARSTTARAARAAQPPRADTSLFPDGYERFGTVETPSGSFGYIRLRSFAPTSGDVDGVVGEFARILSTMPPSGLILDVRGNGGGYINFGERILQMLTPLTITPEPFHFYATALTRRIASATDWLADWTDPIGQAIETGASFSQGFALTPPDWCNDVGQIYQGPVVLITDALCYSTTDMFAAGFQDHGIGKMLGVHNNTGAGGATVWQHSDLCVALATDAANPFVALPQDAGMSVAALRSTRVGTRSGVPLEDLGVVPDEQYSLTREDVLNHNADLIAKAAEILSGMESQTLRMTVAEASPIQHLTLEVEHLDRVDVWIDDRPAITLDVTDGTVEAMLPAPVGEGSVLYLYGYREGQWVVSVRYPA